MKSKTDGDYKKELLERMTNDYDDFTLRHPHGDWDDVDLCDFLIRRGWRNEAVKP